MKYSAIFGRTLRDAPNDAEHIAHKLVLRAGLARSMQAGSYVLMPLGMRVARRIEQIMHEEMEQIDGQEFRTPVIQSAELWQKSQRYEAYGPMMLRFGDRSERPLIFAPTHEEAVAELAHREVSSYRQMPMLIYQIHTKYRDEMRAKGGLMRMREFTMLDAYSLDTDYDSLAHVYEVVGEAFDRILTRCGISFVTVGASGGEMGGKETREYMVLSPAGEDTLVLCSNCDYAANLEIAVSGDLPAEEHTNVPEMQPIETPNCATIADLAAFVGVEKSQTAKAVFFDTPEEGLLFVVIRGDLDVNELKLRAVAGVSALTPASAEQILAAGATPGYASPVGLKNVRVIADQSIVKAGPLVAGANREGYHLLNVFYGRDWNATDVADISTVQAGDPCITCGSALHYERGIELAHIFQLGTRYSEAMGANYLNQNGKAQPIVMGSYGIGVERMIQVIVEQHHDENGIIWPASVAPFDVYLLSIGKGKVQAACDELYATLKAAGVRVLYDDRKERTGVKFNDADLTGMPIRIVVSKRLLKENVAEVKPRNGEAKNVAWESVAEEVKGMLSG